MALLDTIFDPGTYGGQAGGLLELLRQTQMQQQQYQPSAGFAPEPTQRPAAPIAVGSYQMPRIGSQAAFTPDPAAIPDNAQPAQGVGMPGAPQQPQQNGFMSALDSFNSGLQSIGNGGSILGAITGNHTDPISRLGKAQGALVARGMDPAIAQIVTSDPALMRSVVPSLIGTTGLTDDIKEYQFAKKEDPTLTFNKFMSQKKAVSGEFGMQPIWGTGPDGKPAVLQLGKSGEAKQSVLPQGFNLARDPIKVEGPTGTTIIDPQSRQTVGFIPKDVAGAAKAKEIGESEGQAVVNLPTVIATAETTLKTIKQMEEHPGKKNWGTFGVGAMLPDAPGGSTRGFAALLDQVKGQNFMTAFQSLKGAGAITEQEGAKAERAQARLDRAQSEKDFDVAVKDLKEVITAGMERARQKAGVKGSPAIPSAAVSGGASVDDLLKKYGG